MLPSRLLLTTVYRPCRSAARDKISSTTLPNDAFCKGTGTQQSQKVCVGLMRRRPLLLLLRPCPCWPAHQQAAHCLAKAARQVLRDVSKQQRQRDERKKVLAAARRGGRGQRQVSTSSSVSSMPSPMTACMLLSRDRALCMPCAARPLPPATCAPAGRRLLRPSPPAAPQCPAARTPSAR